MKIKIKKGFTLAETLITLTILGVVAAIAVPSIISSVNQRIYISKWKRAYSDFQKVADTIMLEYKVNKFSEAVDIVKAETGQSTYDATATLFSKYFKASKMCVDGTSRTEFNCVIGTPFNAYYQILGRYDKASYYYGYKYLNGGDARYFILNYCGAASFTLKNYTFAWRGNSADGIIVIKTTPANKGGIIGKDIFLLNMSDLKDVKPAGIKNWYTGADYACDKDKQGQACSAKYLFGK